VILNRSGKLRLGTAYLAGFRFALKRAYEAVVEIDVDFSHTPTDLPRLLAAVENADLAVGSRWTPGGGTRGRSLLRKFISRGGSMYARWLLGLSVSDLTSGFKCFRAPVLASIDLGSVQSNGYAFQVEMNYLCQQAGFRTVEVPITFVDRTLGHSKMTVQIIQEAAWRVLQLKFGVQRHGARARPAFTANHGS
jgi:dolichol-phosphate mannosyltransferase